MKSLTELWTVAAHELATWCGVSVTRDVETLRGRCEHEGEAFLTITLPTFASDFEKSLDLGRIAPNTFLSFKKRAGLPAFLSGFLELVFDRHTSVLLDDPSIDAIFAIRQLTLLFKKIEGECTPERNAKVVRSFINCEQDLKRLDKNLDALELDELARLFAMAFGDEVDQVNQEIDLFELSPGHGPGATADRKKGNSKFVQTEWPERLESVFPYLEYVIPNMRYYKQIRQVQFLKPGQERPVKVTLVPKTRKTPRVIAIEPTAMQYMQQALMRSLVPKLESNQFQFLGFIDQTPNRQMAMDGSLTGRLATLDLSEASDRVLNSIVLRLTRAWPSFSEALQASRSRSALLPTGQRVRLSKFASMGSALCFPVEAMVFCTIVLYGIQLAENRRLSRSDLVGLRGRVRVYGDDIIIPVNYTEEVVASLESFGLKVNHGKSFWTGKFRESCGGDFYDGTDVTPVRLKKYAPASRRDAESVIHWVEFSNALFKRGLWKTSEYARRSVEAATGVVLPIVGERSPALGLYSYTGIPQYRMDSSLHRPVVKAFAKRSPIPESPLDGIWALRKTLAGSFEDPSNRSHLSHSGRPAAVHIKQRWMSAL